MQQPEKIKVQGLQSLLLRLERLGVNALGIRRDPILNITGTRTAMCACTSLQAILS